MQNTQIPKISVVISVKNRSEYLRQALVSLQSQTISEWECIVVDDYSSEDIKAVVEQFNDSRFIYVKNTGKPGISAARNLGNSLAQSDWIAVADSDDIYLPRRLEVTLDAIASNPQADIVHANIYFIKDGTYEITRITGLRPYDRKLLYERNMIAHISAAYRKSLFMEVMYSEELDSAVDYDLWLSFADRHAVFHFIEEPVALYRRHSEQISTDPAKLQRQIENAQLALKRHPYTSKE